MREFYYNCGDSCYYFNQPCQVSASPDSMREFYYSGDSCHYYSQPCQVSASQTA